MEIKTAIAEQAASMIPRNGVIFLDAEASHICLAQTPEAPEDLTVFTNSILGHNILSGSATRYMRWAAVSGSSKGIVGHGLPRP